MKLRTLGIEMIETNQNYGTGHMEISNQKVIELTTKENFIPNIDKTLLSLFGKYWITSLN